MIKLFNIPEYKIDTGKFDNLLHGKIVTEFEQAFADYVGADYAVSFNSATSAIFILFSYLDFVIDENVKIPSILPPVVANALIKSNNKIEFYDDINWIGHEYILHKFYPFSIIDSAQAVKKGYYKESNFTHDIIIYSFYPTKPIGSCDGGMIVSNDKYTIDVLRALSFNGMSNESDNWNRKQKYIGHKMYMNSIQAYIAMEGLKKLDDKNTSLTQIRDYYNKILGLNNTSLHLYQVEVKNHRAFINKAKESGIACGLHYEPLHKHDLFKQYQTCDLPLSESFSKVSIPFHEQLTIREIDTVINFYHENKDL